MPPKYPEGIYATRSDYAPQNLVTCLKLELAVLREFLKNNPEVIEEGHLRLVVWTDESGLHYLTIDKKRPHPGHFDPQNYEQPQP